MSVTRKIRKRGDAKAKQKVYLKHVKILCPMTGNVVGEYKVKAHPLFLARCANGSLSAYCSIHGARVFIGGIQLVADLLKKEEAGNGKT